MTAVLLAARKAGDVMPAVKRLIPRASTWILVFASLDEDAYRLKHTLIQSGSECQLILADFRDADMRMQALAMARDFAGHVGHMWDCTRLPPIR